MRWHIARARLHRLPGNFHLSGCKVCCSRPISHCTNTHFANLTSQIANLHTFNLLMYFTLHFLDCTWHVLQDILQLQPCSWYKLCKRRTTTALEKLRTMVLGRRAPVHFDGVQRPDKLPPGIDGQQQVVRGRRNLDFDRCSLAAQAAAPLTNIWQTPHPHLSLHHPFHIPVLWPSLISGTPLFDISRGHWCVYCQKVWRFEGEVFPNTSWVTGSVRRTAILSAVHFKMFGIRNAWFVHCVSDITPSRFCLGQGWSYTRRFLTLGLPLKYQSTVKVKVKLKLI